MQTSADRVEAGHDAPPEVLIRIDDLHRSFDGQPVLRGVSLDVQRGELLALIGKSGCGKSVLLKHVAGLLRPDRGRVLIQGLDVTRVKGKALARLREELGFLFQGGALFDSMTVQENVAFPLQEKTRMQDEEIRERVREELGRVGLSDSEDKHPSQLSGGMQKRVALARELVSEPEIMLFDEPTTGLDPIMGNAILKLIDELHRKMRFTGIIVTHEIHKVFEIVDRVVLLHEGRVQFQGPPEGVLSSDDPLVRQFVRGEIEGPMDVQ